MIKFSELKNKFDQVERGLDDAPRADFTLADSPTLDVNDWYQRACLFVENALNQARNEEQLILNEGENLLEEIVQDSLLDNWPQALTILALHGEPPHSPLVTNPVNVSILAIPLGANLGFPKERLLELGLAALLHDIGKVRVSEKILYKETTLTERESTIIRQYPSDSFNILKALGDQYHYLAECGLQVNERLDGSGYPLGLRGDEINSYAQIIGLVDIYEDITHNRPHREKLLHFQAMKVLIKRYKHAFPREVFLGFLSMLSIFPLHSLVKLNSGAIGRVIQTYADQPLRPRIAIIIDAQRKRAPSSRVIDLRQQPILCVVDAVSEAELIS